MTVTKQQQLEFAAVHIEKWKSGYDFAVIEETNDGQLCVRWPSICSGGVSKKEWQQERDKMQKQDNSWHERGELPPVGSIVTVANDYETHDISDYSRDCIDAECVVMAVFERDNGVNRSKIVCVMEPDGGCYCFLLSMIRPIRTEREKAIDEMVYEMLDSHGDHKVGQRHLEIASKLYDAGYRKVKP